MPAGSQLVNVVGLLNRLPGSRPERMLPQEIANILKSIENCIRLGCAEIVKEAAGAKKAAREAESKSEKKESPEHMAEERPKKPVDIALDRKSGRTTTIEFQEPKAVSNLISLRMGPPWNPRDSDHFGSRTPFLRSLPPRPPTQ